MASLEASECADKPAGFFMVSCDSVVGCPAHIMMLSFMNESPARSVPPVHSWSQ